MGSASKGTRAPFFSRTWDFLERYLPRQAGRSPRTVDTHRDALTVFRRWLRDERGISISSMTFGDCTRDLVPSFLEWVRDGGPSAGTCNNRLAALRSYLWCAAGDDVAIQSVAVYRHFELSHMIMTRSRPVARGPARPRSRGPGA